MDTKMGNGGLETQMRLESLVRFLFIYFVLLSDIKIRLLVLVRDSGNANHDDKLWKDRTGQRRTWCRLGLGKFYLFISLFFFCTRTNTCLL